MELWLTKKIEEEVGLTLRIKHTLHSENTPFQRVEILEMESFGKMASLSGKMILTERDEFFYRSSIIKGLIK
jgi:spermidine synthase